MNEQRTFGRKGSVTAKAKPASPVAKTEKPDRNTSKRDRAAVSEKRPDILRKDLGPSGFLDIVKRMLRLD